jgi:neurotransmitter:Na+ symporter, NSS family
MDRFHWSNRLTFIMAAAGSAVGLGNIWKFPYITGENGGGAFVLVYLLCIAVVGLPVFIAELYIGQQSQRNAIQAFDVLHKKGTIWRVAGFLGVISAFMILSFYSVVGGWVLDFTTKSVLNEFIGKSDGQIRGLLTSLFKNPYQQLFWHFAFSTLVIGIVVRGLKGGIEKWNKILMPALLVLLVILVIRSAWLPGFSKSLDFLFSPNFSKLTASGILEAVGHAFFTLSLGMCAMVTYGSYLRKGEDLVKTAITVALMDTAVALIAGLVIFSVIFTYDLEPGGGPSLMFQTLPMLFSKLEGGYYFSIAFFSLVTFAALTSAISLLEVVVTYLVEQFNMPRVKATLSAGFTAFVIGIFCALSFNVLSDFHIYKWNVFDLLDFLTSKVTLPLGGIIISAFFGWVLGERAVKAVIRESMIPDSWAPGLLWSARIIAPGAIGFMLINSLIS